MKLPALLSILVTSSLVLAQTPIMRTGQKTIYKAGDDGSYQKGKTHTYTRSTLGIVTDHTTGLDWLDNYDANGGTVPIGDGRGAALYCTNVISDLDGGGWRVPTFDELMGIIDKGRGGSLPAFDPIFQYATIGPYWTSTPYAQSGQAWLIQGSDGSDDIKDTSFNNGNFICVRNSN